LKLAGAVENRWHVIAVTAGHDARALRWPTRNLRVGEGWRRLAQLGAWSKGARVVEAQRVHELEWGVDLAQLRSGDAHQPAEEAIVVFEVEGGGGGAGGAAETFTPPCLAHCLHTRYTQRSAASLASTPAAPAQSRNIPHHARLL
jgi:hypothetical protein